MTDASVAPGPTDLVRVLLPAGVGAEIDDDDPSVANLVGTLSDIERLLLSADVAAGRRRSTTGPRLRPIAELRRINLLEAEVADWKARFDRLLTAAGRMPEVADGATVDGRPMPAAGRNVVRCIVDGCTETHVHAHSRWEAAQARGELDPGHTADWRAHEWIEFLRAHHISQQRAISELSDRTGTPVYGLAAVGGRSDLAGMLLDLVCRKAADPATAQEPW